MGSISRRDSLRYGAGIALGSFARFAPAASPRAVPPDEGARPYLTLGDDFTDVPSQ